MRAKGPIALRLAKEAVLKGSDLTLEQGIRLEQDLYVLLQTTADRAEGVRAFLAKRPRPLQESVSPRRRWQIVRRHGGSAPQTGQPRGHFGGRFSTKA